MKKVIKNCSTLDTWYINSSILKVSNKKVETRWKKLGTS